VKAIRAVLIYWWINLFMQLLMEIIPQTNLLHWTGREDPFLFCKIV